MRDRIDRVAGPCLLGLTAVSAWLSLGTLAIVDTHGSRIGALPSLWLLLVGVGAAVALGRLTRVSASILWPLALTALLWLPWLPFPVPAAFLTWTGATEAIVWIAACAGVVAAAGIRVPVPLARRLADPRRAPVVVILIGTACSLAAAAALGPRIPSGDEPHYLIITQSLLLDGDLQIENNHARADYLPYAAILPKPDFLRRGVNGQIYSVHAPGLAALVAPAFALGGYRGVVVFLALLSAIGGALAWHAAWLITRSAAAAWMAWLAVFGSTAVFFHTFTVYPDGAGAVFTMAAVWVLVRLDVDAAEVPPSALALAGTALAALPWLHSRFVIVAAGLGLAVLLRLATGPGRRLHRVMAFAVVPACAAAGWFAYFRIVYGTFNPAAPYGGLVQNRLSTLAPGLPGLFFDQQFGLITTAPIFALALLGLVSLAHRHRRLVVELVVVAVPYLLTVASFMMWWGGHSAPGRFLAILLLPAALPVAWLFHRHDSVWARVSIVAAALVGTAFTALRAGVHGGALLYNGRDGYDLLLDWLSPAVDLPLAFPSFHRVAPGLAIRDVLVWAVALTAALAVVRWATTSRDARARGARGPRPLGRGAAWTIGGYTIAAAVMAASTIVWAAEAGPVLTPATSQLTFLQAWDPTWHPLGVQLPPARLLAREDVLSRVVVAQTTRGPAARADDPLLNVPLVPAGVYEIVLSDPAASGTLDVSVSRTTHTIARVDAASTRGANPTLLRLPVLVHSLTIRAGADMASRPGVVLRPHAIRPPDQRLSSTFALTAIAYGATRFFFMDDRVFPETEGIWTRGARDTDIVVDTSTGAPAVFEVRAGPVPTRVSLSSGDWSAEYALGPGQVQRVEMPGDGQARLVSIATDGGFRPSEHDAASHDRRYLGVRIQVP